MTGDLQNGAAPAGAAAGPDEIAAQRRQARRTALLLGIVAVCVYLGFIVAVGLRN